MKNQKAITLVALVITIIILLILAGITINSLTGSGLFEKTKLAKERTENAEKLENGTLEEYEKELNKYITGEEKPQDVNINIPNVGNIDAMSTIDITTYIAIKSNTRNTLTLSGLEEETYTAQSKTENVSLEKNIIIANSNADSFDVCKILITGTYNGKSYKNNLTVYVEPKNRTTVTDKNGNTKEAFGIYKEQDLIRMQEIVTTGANNKCNAKVMNNIKLNENLYEFNGNGKITFKETAKKYNSIGSVENPYGGIFEGNGKTISGLNIIKGDNEQATGLFGIVSESGEIKNIKVKDSYIYGTRIGGIVGYNEGTIYRCKVESTTIETSTLWAGGIAYTNNGEIIECSTSGYFYGKDIGGIAGINGSNDTKTGLPYNKTTGKIYRCYTSGYIGYNESSSIASHNGVYGGEGHIYDCYSTAKLEDDYHSGTIAAVQSTGGKEGYIYNSYYLNLECNGFAGIVTPEYYGNVSNSYMNDTTITANKLNTNSNKDIWTNDIKDENGNWKYNNGYPILKWQIE